MADIKTKKEKAKEITDKLKEGLKELMEEEPPAPQEENGASEVKISR